MTTVTIYADPHVWGLAWQHDLTDDDGEVYDTLSGPLGSETSSFQQARDAVCALCADLAADGFDVTLDPEGKSFRWETDEQTFASIREVGASPFTRRSLRGGRP